jgi:hypothetical protein
MAKFQKTINFINGKIQKKTERREEVITIGRCHMYNLGLTHDEIDWSEAERLKEEIENLHGMLFILQGGVDGDEAVIEGREWILKWNE